LYESVDSAAIRFNTHLPSETDSGSPMQKTTSSTGYTRQFRQRLRASGGEEVLFQLPRETIALLDELKERHGLRNRSLALLQLIERGKEATQ